MYTPKRRTMIGLFTACTLMLTFASGMVTGSAQAQGRGRPAPVEPREPREPREPGNGAGREKLTCDERCQKVYDTVFKACSDGAGTDCESKAKTAQEACATRCANRPAPVSCEDRCAKHATEAKDRCLAAGGTEADCAARAGEMLTTCLTRCANPPEVKPQGCDERCANHARRLQAACEREGGTDCAGKAATALDECLKRCENPPAQPTCQERCDNHAARVEQACLNSGGSAEVCAAKKAEALTACTTRCENPPAPREPREPRQPGRPGRP